VLLLLQYPLLIQFGFRSPTVRRRDDLAAAAHSLLAGACHQTFRLAFLCAASKPLLTLIDRFGIGSGL
jgi:hypothetical protein